MKVGKEEVMACLTAVANWVSARDHPAEQREWEARLETVRAALADIPGVNAPIVHPVQHQAEFTPVITLTWDAAQVGCGYADIHAALLADTPRIYLWLNTSSTDDDCIVINPYMLQPGQAETIAAHLSEKLRNGDRYAHLAGPDYAPAGDRVT